MDFESGQHVILPALKLLPRLHSSLLAQVAESLEGPDGGSTKLTANADREAARQSPGKHSDLGLG